jgi:hypothetical protein
MTQTPKTWPAKDPQAVLDYLYAIPLDEGDSVSSHTFTKLQGDVVVDSQDRSGANVTAFLSGGTDGETAVFRVAWDTLGGRTDDAIILLPVLANEPADLVLTGYAKPSAAHLILRYPAFASVPATTIRYWLTDAERYVTSAWSEGDYAAGLMALAAHNMVMSGLGAEAAAVSDVPAGITRMKSGSFELQFTESAANARASGGSDASRYGQEYALLLRRNRGGPYVMPTGALPYNDGRIPSWEV